MNFDFETEENFERRFIDNPLFDLTPQTFSLEIEKVVKQQGLNYLEAVSYLCEQFEMDEKSIPALLTPTMKDKIEMVAISHNNFRKHKQPEVKNFFTEK